MFLCKDFFIHSVSCITAYKYNLRIRLNAFNFLVNFYAALLRHYHVKEEQLNSFLICEKLLDRLLTILSKNYFVHAEINSARMSVMLCGWL